MKSQAKVLLEKMEGVTDNPDGSQNISIRFEVKSNADLFCIDARKVDTIKLVENPVSLDDNTATVTITMIIDDSTTASLAELVSEFNGTVLE